MPQQRHLQTIESHILDLQRMHPSASGDFTGRLNDISLAAKIVSQEVNQAGLAEDILAGRFAAGDTVRVEAGDGKLLFEGASRPNGDAPRVNAE